MKKIAVLGSTGSIGRSVLEVLRTLKGYKVRSLSARRRWRELSAQAAEFKARRVSIADEEQAADLRATLEPLGVEVLSGCDSLDHLARDPEVDIVVLGIVGAAGLRPALAAVEAGKTLAIANKESLVMAGNILMSLARKRGATVIPIDSEHSAIFQTLRVAERGEVRRVIITASGGPFRRMSRHELRYVTREQALSHPTWAMGPKISIDSATLMNKALEIIEAKWLFDLDASQIEVLIHPQSVIHSMVEFRDGSTMAHLGRPDMKVPIQYALTFPERRECRVERYDFAEAGGLTFFKPDMERFPALALGYRAASEGGTTGAVMSGANEVAVDAFLSGRIGFTQIVTLVESVMDSHSHIEDPSLDQVFEADTSARERAEQWISRLA